MSKNKATHMGSCQCCGSVQKLPGGVLSQHGYRVLWSSFHGVCRGAGELPYEQSCELIKGFISSATKRMDKLIVQRDSLLVPATEAVCWVQDDRPNQAWGMHEKTWRIAEILTDEKGAYFINQNGKRESFSCHSAFGTPLEIATKMNKHKANSLQVEIKALERYITWQQERVQAWKLEELKPIKTGA